MVDLGTVALVGGGTVLLFAGAALSVYGVVLLGGILGGSGGYLVAPSVGAALGLEGLAAVAGAVAIGAVVGVVLGRLLLSAAVAGVSFVVGTFFGITALAPAFVDGGWYLEVAGGVAFGFVMAGLGLLLTRWTMVFVTAAVGAAFASRSLTVADFQAAQEAVTIDPLLFDATAPLFLGLFTLGVLSQFGLFKFGYVTKLASVLPGASVLPRKREESDPA